MKKKLLTDKEIFESSAIVAKNVGEFLTQNGVPKHKQAKILCDILNVSPSHAHRKITGASPWEIAHLQKLASYFGKAASACGIAFSNVSKCDQVLSEATFIVGDFKLACLIAVGSPVYTIKNTEIVAWKCDGSWIVTASTAVPEFEKNMLYKVRHLELIMEGAQILNVANLTKDTEYSKAIHEYLKGSRIESISYFDPHALLDDLEHRNFDAYIIDWGIEATGDITTVEEMLKLIRFKYKRSEPIFLLFKMSDVNSSELARLIVDYNVSAHKKPTNLIIFSAEISRALFAKQEI
jgi:hypothetical protein